MRTRHSTRFWPRCLPMQGKCVGPAGPSATHWPRHFVGLVSHRPRAFFNTNASRTRPQLPNRFKSAAGNRAAPPGWFTESHLRECPLLPTVRTALENWVEVPLILRPHGAVRRVHLDSIATAAMRFVARCEPPGNARTRVQTAADCRLTWTDFGHGGNRRLALWIARDGYFSRDCRYAATPSASRCVMRNGGMGGRTA